MNQEKQPKKKWPWILVGILIVLAIGIVLLVKWQWNNILALHYATSYSQEELQQLRSENEKLVQEVYKQFPDVDLSRLPEEASELLQNGELSSETAVAILTGKITWEDYQDQEKPVGEQSSSASASRVDDIIARIYVLRSGYVGKLDSLVSQALEEYRSGSVSKTDLISKYVGIGYGLEGECNTKMEALLSELSAELSKTGGDFSLVDTVRRTYQSEKSIKKAEMIAKYQK